MNISRLYHLPALFTLLFVLGSCSTFTYRTYQENELIEDPEPDYTITLDKKFQDYTSFMFIGNRVENFGTYFNTFFNAKENYAEAYQDYVTRVIATYSERLDSIYATPKLSQESIDKFNKAIEKASRVIQYHKSTAFMDDAVLLIGKSYFYLGDYLKAERKFGEFITKLGKSTLLEEALLFLAKTQLRLKNTTGALERLEFLTKNSKDNDITAGSYQTLAEYYLMKKDFDAATKNFKRSVELSDDEELKAQMQYLVASVVVRKDPGEGAREFANVLNYSPSFDLEFYARYNYLKNLILDRKFKDAKPLIDDFKVKYKDNNDYLSDIFYLGAKYYSVKEDNKKAVSEYHEVIRSFPKTAASSDASFDIAVYYENKEKDLLNAYRYYKFSTEISSTGRNSKEANEKLKVLKRYFDLRSIIAGSPINTDYDTKFQQNTNSVPLEPGKQEIEQDEGRQGKPGGSASPSDSLVDSLGLKKENISKAEFELAELFQYSLNMQDSAEYYFNIAYEGSENSDFKAKCIFALANLYSSTSRQVKAEELFRRIITEFPESPVANESKKLLNIEVNESRVEDPADSLYRSSELKFISSEYETSLLGFKQLLMDFPASKYAGRSMYAVGWIYENVLMLPDSAYVYFASIIRSDPTSEVAGLVAGKVKEYENVYFAKDTSLVTDTSSSGQEIPPPEKKEKEENRIENTDPLDIKENPDMKKEEKQDGTDIK